MSPSRRGSATGWEESRAKANLEPFRQRLLSRMKSEWGLPVPASEFRVVFCSDPKDSAGRGGFSSHDFALQTFEPKHRYWKELAKQRLLGIVTVGTGKEGRRDRLVGVGRVRLDLPRTSERSWEFEIRRVPDAAGAVRVPLPSLAGRARPVVIIGF